MQACDVFNGSVLLNLTRSLFSPTRLTSPYGQNAASSNLLYYCTLCGCFVVYFTTLLVSEALYARW